MRVSPACPTAAHDRGFSDNCMHGGRGGGGESIKGRLTRKHECSIGITAVLTTEQCSGGCL